MSQISGVSSTMLDLEESEKQSANVGSRVTEDSEYVRLVISNDPSVAEADTLQSRAEQRKKSYTWWINAIILFFITTAILLIFLKWGVPFLFEKVCYYT